MSCLALTAAAAAHGAHAQTAPVLRLPGEDPVESDLATPEDVDTSPISNPRPKPPRKPVVAPPTTLEIRLPEPELEPPPPPPRRAVVEDPYAAQGVPMGALRLFPALEAGIVITDNVDQANDDRHTDVGLRLQPSLALRSDWVRHALEINADADVIFYHDEPDFDSHNAHADARLSLDVRRSTTLDLTAGYDLNQDSAGDPEVPDSAVGYRTDHFITAAARLTHRAGRLETSLRAGADIQLYEDVDLAGGGKEDNTDRNYVQPNVALRLGYETSPAIRPFIEVAYRPRIHQREFDRNGLRRDSDGIALSAGSVFDLDTIWTGEAALIYIVRDYDDPALKTVDAIGVSGRLTWRPTELTALTLSAATTIDESSSASEGGTRNYDLRLDAAHELRDNVTLESGFGVNFDDSKTGPDDVTLRGNAGIVYRLNPWAAWTAGYEFIYFDTEAPSSDYLENRFTTGFEFRR